MSLLADTIILSKLQEELIVELFLTCLKLNGSAQKRVTVQNTKAHFDGHRSCARIEQKAQQPATWMAGKKKGDQLKTTASASTARSGREHVCAPVLVLDFSSL